MSWRLLLLTTLLASAPGCRKAQPAEASAADASVGPAPLAAATATPDAGGPPRAGDVHNHGKAPLAVCEPHGKAPLEAARDYYDARDYEQALSCAAQASAFNPDEPAAHAERGGALSALERLDEAKLAYARALALDPDLPDALLGAAHLYTVSLNGSRDHDELGLLYSERGLALARRDDDRQLVAEFAALSAMAFNDLGQSRRALERADQVLALQADHREAQYERALALFELCRFPEAREAFTALLDDGERGAHAHHHLGLLLEREGDLEAARQHFARARALRPDDFREPPVLSREAFAAELRKAVLELPPDMRKDLDQVVVKAEELPAEADLVGNDPPLSPTIVGLFRGPPLNLPCEEEDLQDGECRSVILYRLNLGRAVDTHEELLEQLRVTLLHEVGHLRGEDDLELAARGLE